MSPAINTPLLTKHGSSSTSFGVVFNISTTIIGTGIMSMPAAFKVLGVIPTVLIMIIIAWLSTVSVGFLMKSTIAGDSTTYAGVMKESFGKIGFAAVQIATLVATFGCMIVSSIIIGDVLSGNVNEQGSQHFGVLQEWFGSHWWNTRFFALLFIYVVVLLPLVLFRRAERLAISSAVSFLLAVLFVVITTVLAISAVVEGQTKNPRLFPDLNNGEGSFWSLFTASPVIVTAFTFHFNVHPIGFELKDPLHMIPASKISVFLCAAIYFATGLSGYLLFGDATMSDILVNFDTSSGIGFLLNDIVRLSYVFHLVLVFPLMNFSLRANLDELLFPTKPPLAQDTKRFLGLTLSLLVSGFLFAIAVPDVWYFFQFSGATTTVSISFIFPAAIVLRNVHGVSTSREKIVAGTMLVFAVATSIIAISVNLHSLIVN